MRKMTWDLVSRCSGNSNQGFPNFSTPLPSKQHQTLTREPLCKPTVNVTKYEKKSTLKILILNNCHVFRIRILTSFSVFLMYADSQFIFLLTLFGQFFGSVVHSWAVCLLRSLCLKPEQITLLNCAKRRVAHAMNDGFGPAGNNMIYYDILYLIMMNKQ